MPLDRRTVEQAREVVRGRIRTTPVEPSPGLSQALGSPVWLKLENLQTTGSFKIRGAFFRMSLLSDSERRSGVVTCSAGNHGKAVAFVARELGIAARIYLPRGVDESKRRAIESMGAKAVVTEYPGYDDAEEFAKSEAARSGLPFLSAFDDDAVIAGNGGTLALELLEQVPDAGAFVVPVGGGGLAAGVSFVAKDRDPDAIVVGCQHEGSPALKLSLERGSAVTRLPAFETTAGGLEGGIGEKPFEILRTRVDRVALVSEDEIFEGVRWMLDRHQYLIESSAAAVVAACLTGKAGRFDRPVVVVLSGRNVALSTLRRILNRTSR
jgi:threonine dehydratase